MEYIPHDYQKFVIDWIIDKLGSAIFLDMGMGKTVCTLTAIDELMYNYFDIAMVLVIAPLRVAQDTWSSEIQKWEHLRHLKISKVLGAKEALLKALGGRMVGYGIKQFWKIIMLLQRKFLISIE